MAAPVLLAAVDFKSSDCFLSFHADGPAHAVPQDYAAPLVVVEWEAPAGDLSPPAEPTPIRDRTRAHKVRNYERVAAVQGLRVPAAVFAERARSSRALLAGLRHVRTRGTPAQALAYVALGFSAYVDASVDVGNPAVAEGLLEKACGVSPPPGAVSRIMAEAEGPIRGSDVMPGAAVRPCTWRVGKVDSLSFEGLSMARLQLELAGAARRRPDVVPDVPFTWSPGHRTVAPDAPGMPGGPTRQQLLAAYNANSRTPRPARLTIVLYLDIKSPHAFLGVEPARALEREFDVRVRTLPFDMDIGSIHGEDVKPDPGKPAAAVTKPRTEQQRANLLVGYADIRRLGQLRGITIYGQEKVWDSTLTCLAILFCETRGRWAQDAFVDEAFELTWKRKLNLEDPAAISALVAKCTRDQGDAAAFLAYARGDGPKELEGVLRTAHERGIWGIPSFWVDGEMYWGKEQLGLIRKKLKEMGLAREGAFVEVPYLFRPPEGAASL